MIVNKSLQTEYDPFFTLDIGLNMNLLKDNCLSIGLSAADIFYSKKNRYKIYYDSNLMVVDRAIPTQYAELSISYRFKGGKQFNPKINVEKNSTDRFTK